MGKAKDYLKYEASKKMVLDQPHRVPEPGSQTSLSARLFPLGSSRANPLAQGVGGDVLPASRFMCKFSLPC